MNLRRLLFGRPSGAGRAGANPAQEEASLESAKPGPEVSAPQVSAPRTHVPAELAITEPESEPEALPEAVKPELEASQKAVHPEPDDASDFEVDEVEDTDEPAGPEPEISPRRLDEALRRLREENPAPSEEAPSEPSE
jgi:hypothetical protein